MKTVAIIGGTGLYDLEGLADWHSEVLDTPFGSPSSPIVVGKLGNIRLLFLARHGVRHTLLPSEINYRANIYALKKLGAESCISVSAVGSLAEELMPGHVVVPDQFIDRTVSRENSFFGSGVVAHISFADPFCPLLRRKLFEAANELCLKNSSAAHDGGTYICIEGPAFSTRAESHLYRSWGARIIGMTGLPEARLAREAEMSYATLALVTDYDCWRSHGDEVNVLDIVEVLRRNTGLAKKILERLVPALEAFTSPESIRKTLASAILTGSENITEERKEALAPLIGRYLGL